MVTIVRTLIFYQEVIVAISSTELLFWSHILSDGLVDRSLVEAKCTHGRSGYWQSDDEICWSGVMQSAVRSPGWRISSFWWFSCEQPISNRQATCDDDKHIQEASWMFELLNMQFDIQPQTSLACGTNTWSLQTSLTCGRSNMILADSKEAYENKIDISYFLLGLQILLQLLDCFWHVQTYWQAWSGIGLHTLGNLHWKHQRFTGILPHTGHKLGRGSLFTYRWNTLDELEQVYLDWSFWILR